MLREHRSAQLVLELSIDETFLEAFESLPVAQLGTAPWTMCYAAFLYRVSVGNYTKTLDLGLAAMAIFEQTGNADGYGRALAEVAIAQYHFGQYQSALSYINRCPVPAEPVCIAALYFATYLNLIGIDALPDAIEAATNALDALKHDQSVVRRANWSIVIQRNLAAAYHFQGKLDIARSAIKAAFCLARRHGANKLVYAWILYEWGLLEQRAGRLIFALKLLGRAQRCVEQIDSCQPIWRWIVAVEGHTLRDMGDLNAADECYNRVGWGEGDNGPLMLWLLQGRYTEARFAAEARLVAAHASGSHIEAANINIMLALIDFESSATPELRKVLYTAADQYAKLGFHHNRASTLFHLAAVEYALGDDSAGDRALEDALRFGATHDYLNFAWWHPERMRMLLQRAIKVGIQFDYSCKLLRERELDQNHHPAGAGSGSGASIITLAHNTHPSLALLHFGSFEAWVDGALLPNERWKGYQAGALRMQRLLYYLARHREPQSMRVIARYVWSDTWESIDLAGNFHLTVAALRRVLEPHLERGQASQFVMTTAQGFQLSPALNVTIDLIQFETQLRRARASDKFGHSEAARAAFIQVEQLYRGDYALAKIAPGECEEYRQGLLEAVRWLANDDLRREDITSCIARASRLLHEERLDPDIPALLIQAYLALGNRRAARRQYERYARLHDGPSPVIMQLARAHGL